MGELIIPHKGKQLPFSDLVDKFLRNKDISSETRRGYRIALEHLSNFFAQKGTVHPIPEDLIEFRDGYLAALDLDARTRALYFYAVKSFFSFLARFGIYPNVGQFVRGARRPEIHARAWLTAEQLRKVLDSIERKSVSDYRDYALINFLARTALRPIEVVRARIEDIQVREGVRVLMVQGAGRQIKDEFVVVTEAAWQPVVEYHRLRKELVAESPIFAAHSPNNSNRPMSTRMVRAICRERFLRAGLDVSNISAFSLRHSAAALALQGGAQLEELQAMMRHKSIETTRIYLRDLERLKSAAEKKIDF